MKRLWLDVKTTGRNSRRHSLIQLAGIIEIDDIVQEEFCILLRPMPGEFIDDAVMETNRLDRSTIMDYPPAHEGFYQFCRIMEHYVDVFSKQDKFTVYAYNAPNDEQFVRQLFLKCGSKFFGAYFWWPWIDAAGAIHEYLCACGRRQLMPNGKLASMAEALRVPLPEGPHDVMANVRLTRECWFKTQDLNIRHICACHGVA